MQLVFTDHACLPAAAGLSQAGLPAAGRVRGSRITMIVGSGIDIAEPKRLEEAAQRHGRRFLERVFTPAEIAYCERHRNRWERYAARFAAKEAAFKALGTGWRGGVRWRDVEVRNQRSGQPTLHLSGQAQARARAAGVKHISLSLTHSPQFVLAQVIFED